jgi:predicted metalloendopeptidase
VKAKSKRDESEINLSIFLPLQLDQLVLALPSRDYYLKASSEGDLKAYQRYMTQTAILLGANAENAARELEHVVMFEKKLANVSNKNSISQLSHVNLSSPPQFAGINS